MKFAPANQIILYNYVTLNMNINEKIVSNHSYNKLIFLLNNKITFPLYYKITI